MQVWAAIPQESQGRTFTIPVNHEPFQVKSGQVIELEAGSRVTLVPGIYHQFCPESDECILGEVSTANDDLHDNYFVNRDIGRYPSVEEDEPAYVRLLSDR